MSKLNLQIPIPAFIESIVVYFLLRYRKKHFGYAFRKIKLNKGKYAIVSPEDYAKLSEYDWQYVENKSKNRYGARIDDGKIIYMHRQIMNAPKGTPIDHKDHNGLNNTRENLRLATISENARNCEKTKRPTSSKYKGVCWNKKSKKWQAHIHYNGISIHLGLFDSEEDAAKAYDEAAKIYHGEFAVLNFPEVLVKAGGKNTLLRKILGRCKLIL